MTYVKTIKGTRYPVTAIEQGKLAVRQPSGKKRLLTVKDVGRARYDAAVAHYFSEQRA
ncbi:MAG TPA: hypothetical protein VFE08_14540 [Candidatus Sulfotelmatobacter sp.]|jgi:hypothetical protein|nr:hypothetical protein [Candidatus Sulfotelmatobacter sp.]